MLLLSTPLSAAEPQAAAKTSADLSGVVQTSDGRPVEGAAVVIRSAGPREGEARLTGHCYPDCFKHARTDASGRFTISNVDGALLYGLIVKAEGWGQQSPVDVDPRDESLVVTLRPSALDTIEEQENTVVGRVVAPDGTPVAGAIVRPRGYQQGDSGVEGSMHEVAEVAVTDAEGRFAIASALRVTALHLVVHARSYVSQFFSDVDAGGAGTILTLSSGLTLKGRVVHEGKPLGDVMVGACFPKRTSGMWWGPWETITAADGSFALPHVAPNQELAVYAKMESLREVGAAPSVSAAGAEGESFDLGDLEVTPGHTLRGKIRVSGGRPLPERLGVTVWREGPFDWITVRVEPNGEFRIDRLPGEVLHVGVAGFAADGVHPAYPWPYHLSSANPCLDVSNPQHLLGRLAGDTVLEIELEPGQFVFPAEFPAGAKAIVDRLRESPLRGIEQDAAKETAK